MFEDAKKFFENSYEIWVIVIAFAGWIFAFYKDKTMYQLQNKAKTYESILSVVYQLERKASLGELSRDEYEVENAKILSIDLYGNDKILSNLNNLLDIVMLVNNAYKSDKPITDLESRFFKNLNVLSKSMRQDLGYKKMKNDPTTLSEIEFID